MSTSQKASISRNQEIKAGERQLQTHAFMKTAETVWNRERRSPPPVALGDEPVLAGALTLPAGAAGGAAGGAAASGPVAGPWSLPGMPCGRSHGSQSFKR